MRKRMIIFVSLILFGVAVYGLKQTGYGVIYQPTASMPKGFYWMVPVRSLEKNDIVLFRPPLLFRRFLLTHHWIPDNGLLMKYVVGVPGDEVCNRREILTINHRVIASLYRFYEGENPLPKKTFCQRLEKDQYLLMSLKEPRSFDGRYIGPVRTSEILGKCQKIGF